MKTITDIIFPKKFKAEAEEYIAYKRSLGFKFSMDDQRKLLYMLNHIYIHNHNDVTHLTKDAVDSFLSLSMVVSLEHFMQINLSFASTVCICG